MFLEAILPVFLLGTFASAFPPVVGDPTGNAIYTPSVNQSVPKCQPFEIKWNATTTGQVALLLFHGPSANALQMHSVIADGVDNTGSFTWTPTADLEVVPTSGYGIQLVVEKTGQYQWSPAFGIGSGSSCSGRNRSMTTSMATAQAVSSAGSANATAVVVKSASYPGDTTAPFGNSSVAQPTSTMTALGSLTTSGTGNSTSAFPTSPSSAVTSPTATRPSSGAARGSHGILGLVGVVAGVLVAFI